MLWGVIFKTKMAKRKVEITEAQLNAIRDAGDWFSAISGGMAEESEKHVKKIIKHIDNFLKDNKLKPRDYA